MRLPQITELREFLTGIVGEIDSTLSVHDFRTVIGKTHTNLIFDIVLPFESIYSEKEIVDLISAKVIEARPNHYCVVTVDRG